MCLRGEDNLIPITAATDMRSVEDFRELIIKRADNSVVRVRDVATVELGGDSYNNSYFQDGERGVAVIISPTPDGNPLDIVEGITAPPGMQVVNNWSYVHRLILLSYIRP